MTVQAIRRHIEGWAESLVYRRRQRKLMRLSTSVICVATIFIAIGLQSITDVDYVFAWTAMVFGSALVVALVVEASCGLRNLLRTDVVMLLALYGLVFLEFLFPQDSFVGHISIHGARTGIFAILVGFSGIALGRHIKWRVRSRPPQRDLATRSVIQLFLIVTAFGYLHILLAVHFDIFEAIRQMSLPRFAQSWSRGRYGGLSALLNEVGLLIFLIPPLAGIIFAEFRRYGAASLVFAAAVFLLTLYKGFAGGTRSVFVINLITFTIAYFVSRPQIMARDILLKLTPIAAVAALGSVYMLEFREVGLARYEFDKIERETLLIDLNLINISQLTEVFPARYDFLGLEIPYNAVIRPIPRAIWPGKPEGLSVGIEEALDAKGMTLAATFVGEAYMAGGLYAVALTALILGSLAGTWNLVGVHLESRFVRVLYASGFFAATLAMRSMLQVAPAVLPSLALYLYGYYWFTIKGGRLRSNYW